VEGAESSTDIETYQVNFIIAPRINAMGRMEHAVDSLRLLCTKDKKQAEKLAHLLSRTNRERQDVVEKVVIHAEKETEDKKFSSAIILAHESYHEGVIGLAAGKLAEKYFLPTIVISKGKKISKASARSISGFNIIESIHETGDLIENGGGHPMAAGFNIRTKNISDFSKSFENIAQSKLNGDILTKSIKIDCQIDFSVINNDFYQELKKFEPFGVGNPTPLFISKKVKVLQVKTVGFNAKHLKATLVNNGKVIEAIGFNLGNKLTEVLKTDIVDICFSVDENEWNGTKKLQIKLKDLKPSQS
jgi:single-stranded-DNA-specific exonuclease